jgi:putative ABC transport system permease protein
VVVIDSGAAAQLGGPEKALGQSIVRVSEENQRSVVIGVVNALRLDEVDDPHNMTILAPNSQKDERYFSIALRAAAGTQPASLKRALQETVASVDADMPVYWLRTYPEIRRVTMATEHVLGYIFSGMGIVALLLSAAGLYGLVAFLGSQRTKEFGLRRALGAPAGQVVAALLNRTGLHVLAGAVLGMGLGLPVAVSLRGMFLVDIRLDYAVLSAVVSLLIAAVVASLIPTRRALAVQPQIALRGE